MALSLGHTKAMPDSDTPPSLQIARLFDTVADDYDQSGVPFFQPIAEGLVSAVSPQPGERVLDIGCGRGAVTERLARSVLPTGEVTAIDISPEMVRHTKDLLGALGVDATVAVMDATDPHLPDAAYDLVTSSLVLFFLPDPAAVVRRWLRLVAPGGRIGVATFGRQDPVWESVDALFAPYLPPQMRDPRTVGADSPFASDDGMERLFTSGDVRTVHTEHLDLRVPFADAATWRAFSMGTGQRGMWARVPEEERPRIFGEATTLLEQARDVSGEIVLRQEVRYTVAQV
jgi:ubiquinone/menaquinone biosynthesis C-methylase UbiE